MFEPITGIYRFNEKDGQYDSCCTLIFDEETVVIKGVSTPISKRGFRELEEFLREQGVQRVRYKRRSKWNTYTIKEKRA